MEIEFTRADGKKCRGFLAMPSDGEKAPSLILMHEWWGITDQIKRTALRLAEEGFRVLVPDLFDGRTAALEDVPAAEALMSSIRLSEVVDQVIPAAARHLRERVPGSRCGIVGFCMGGALALAAAAKVRELDAAVVFYGIPNKDLADPRLVRIPLQCHFATRDDWCTPQRVDELERELKAGGVAYELYRYDAVHAFMNEDRPNHYDPVAARQARDRALAFLEATVGGHLARTASS